MPDFTRFMTKDEVLAVLADLHRRSELSRTSFCNLIIFRFACCCGLRRKEVAGLIFTDLILAGARPCIHIRKWNTKGRPGQRHTRKVPLWWDAGTLADIKKWVEYRRQMGATAEDPIICSLTKANFGKALTAKQIAKRWKTAIRCLGPERVRQLSVHCGRHTFASLSFDAGHSAVEVQEALGHKSIHTTSIYLHGVPRDDVPDIFVA